MWNWEKKEKKNTFESDNSENRSWKLFYKFTFNLIFQMPLIWLHTSSLYLSQILEAIAAQQSLFNSQKVCGGIFTAKNKKAHVSPGQYTFKWSSQTIEATESIRPAPNNSLTSWCLEICSRATKRRHEVYFYCIAHTEKDASSSLYIKVTFSQENPW